MHFWIDSKKICPVDYYKHDYSKHQKDEYLIATKNDNGDMYYQIAYFTNYFYDSDYDLELYNMFYNYITNEYGTFINILYPDYWTTIKNPSDDKFVLP